MRPSRSSRRAASCPPPWRGRVRLSRRLRDDLPHTLVALARGELTEDRAFAVAREVAHLDPEQRRAVDVDLEPRLPGLGDHRLREAVRRSCLATAAAEARRHRRARADRRVTTRRLDDGTGQLVATLPLEVLADVRACLDDAAATARVEGDPRTAGQVRADTRRGIPARRAVHRPRTPRQRCCQGHAPTPLRRSRRPVAGRDGVLRPPLRRAAPELLRLRDGGTCRTPGCDAPIRHLDHVQGAADDGRTSAVNGQGLCERCNYVKGTPGWTSWVPVVPPGARHEVHGVTEHLRITRSTSPPLPGGPAGATDYSPAER